MMFTADAYDTKTTLVWWFSTKKTSIR